MSEKKEFPFGGMVASGFGMLVSIFLIIAVIVLSIIFLPEQLDWLAGLITGIGFVGIIIILCGFFILQPNQSVVMIFFGKYK